MELQYIRRIKKLKSRKSITRSYINNIFYILTNNYTLKLSYLTIIVPQARMGSESIAHEAEGYLWYALERFCQGY